MSWPGEDMNRLLQVVAGGGGRIGNSYLDQTNPWKIQTVYIALI